MKNFQQNLLIALALALCGLCAFQWREQTIQRGEIATLSGIVSGKNVVIRDATNSLAVANHQLAQMDARMAELKAGAAANEQLVISQKADIARLQLANSSLTNQLAEYQAATGALEAKLKQTYADLEKQNGAITNLVAQRDDLVKKFNDEVRDRNDVVAKYNALAKEMENLQKTGSQK